jgi:hypothetical protein
VGPTICPDFSAGAEVPDNFRHAFEIEILAPRVPAVVQVFTHFAREIFRPATLIRLRAIFPNTFLLSQAQGPVRRGKEILTALSLTRVPIVTHAKIPLAISPP